MVNWEIFVQVPQNLINSWYKLKRAKHKEKMSKTLRLKKKHLGLFLIDLVFQKLATN